MDDFLIVKQFVEDLIIRKRNIGGLRILALRSDEQYHASGLIVYNEKILYEIDADLLEDGRISISYVNNTVPGQNIPDMVSFKNISQTVEVVAHVLIESNKDSIVSW